VRNCSQNASVNLLKQASKMMLALGGSMPTRASKPITTFGEKKWATAPMRWSLKVNRQRPRNWTLRQYFSLPNGTFYYPNILFNFTKIEFFHR